MHDIVPTVRQWYDQGLQVGLATVVAVHGSAPRQPGAALALGPGENVAGSVSGGCVEGAVLDLAREAAEGAGPALHTFGYSDQDAFAVGLTCGGVIEVFVEVLDARQHPWLAEVFASVERGEPVALVTLVGAPHAGSTPQLASLSFTAGTRAGVGPGPRVGVEVGAKMAIWPTRAAGSLGDSELDAAVAVDARGMLAGGATGVRHYGPTGERRGGELAVFVESFAPPPRMYVFGAIDFAAAVAHMGVFLGYHVTVCDARATFATPRRFPQAHEVVVDWPHRLLGRSQIDERTVVVVLTHDPKFDVPLLEVALRSPARYIGALGSRRTHLARLAQLREAGVPPGELARLRSPIGLDLGGRTPEETAVSIAAEIVQTRWGGSGAPLSLTRGAIHRETARTA